MSKILKWTGLGIGVAVLAAAAFIAVGSIDAEAPDTSMFVNPLEVPAEADNIFCGLMALTNVVSEKTGLPILESVFSEENLKFWRSPRGKRNPGQRDALLEEAAEILPQIHEAMRRKTWYSVDADGKRIIFPNMSLLQRIFRLLAAETDSWIDHGNVHAAIESTRDMLQFVRRAENDSETIITWLVVDAFLGSANTTVSEVVKSGKATDDDLHLLLSALRDFDMAGRKERVQRTLNNEFSLCYMQLRENIDDPAGFKRGMESCGWTAFPFVSALMPYAYHKNRTCALYVEELKRAKACFDIGYDEEMWKAEEKCMIDPNSPSDRLDFGPNFAGRKMVSVLLPGWHSFAESIAKTSFAHEATETIVAAELFRRRTGAYPKSLAELVPEFLQSEPDDPFVREGKVKYDPETGDVWTGGPGGTFNRENVCSNARSKYGVVCNIRLVRQEKQPK